MAPSTSTSSSSSVVAKKLLKNRTVFLVVAIGLMILIFILSNSGADPDFTSFFYAPSAGKKSINTNGKDPFDRSGVVSIFSKDDETADKKSDDKNALTKKSGDVDDKQKHQPSSSTMETKKQQHDQHHSDGDKGKNNNNNTDKKLDNHQQQQTQLLPVETSSVPQMNKVHSAGKNVGILLTRAQQECDAALKLIQQHASSSSSSLVSSWIIVGLLDFQCVLPNDNKNSNVEIQFLNCDNKNDATFLVGVSTCTNLALKTLTSSNNFETNWIFLVTSWPNGLQMKTLEKLVSFISTANSEVGLVQSSDFNNAAMLISFPRIFSSPASSKTDNNINNNNNTTNIQLAVGLFDENLVSFQGDMFCTECTDLMWRANLLHVVISEQEVLSALANEDNNNNNNNNNNAVAKSAQQQQLGGTRRKIIREELVKFSATFVPDPKYFQHNMDYFMQKWGHAFQYELLFPRPPSGITSPFNVSSLPLSFWKVDRKRNECLASKSSSSWCWYDLPQQLANVKTSPIESIAQANLQKPTIRPSHWFKRDVARQKIINSHPLPPIEIVDPANPNPDDKSEVYPAEWLKTIKEAVIRGKTAPAEDTMPVLVSLLYTDCDFQRTMLGSIKVPLKRLIIAWNGHDGCAQRTVNYLRQFLPAESLAVVFYPSNRGYSAAYNGGFQLALSEAARHNEEPPRWGIVSNGDIKYDGTLEHFVKFANKEMATDGTSAAFFFGGGVSFCTVGTTLLAAERAGFLDDNFFPSYNEDIDYMWRAHLAGLTNKHDNQYKFDHRNGGSYHGKNRTLVDTYISRFTRGNTKEFCHSKWGDCEGVKVWSILPPSGWHTPFRAIGVPFTYWTPDHRRIDCINGLGGPTYVNDGACWFDGTTLLEDFPDAILPRHIVAPPREIASKEVLGKPIVYPEMSSELPDIASLLSSHNNVGGDGANNQNHYQQQHQLLAIIGVYSSSTYGNFKSLLRELGARQHVTSKFLIGVQSLKNQQPVTTNNNNNNNVERLPVDTVRTQLEKSHPHQVSLSSLSAFGIARSLNVGLNKLFRMKEYFLARNRRAAGNNNNNNNNNNNHHHHDDHNDWILIFAESRSVKAAAIENLLLEAEKHQRFNMHYQQTKTTTTTTTTKSASPDSAPSSSTSSVITSNSFFVVGDDFNLVVFLVHASLFEFVGNFDENFASQPDDSVHLFCGECVDFWWRAQLGLDHFHQQRENRHSRIAGNFPRKVSFHSRIVGFSRQFFNTPTSYWSSFSHQNMVLPGSDYLMQKWGHSFQHELILSHPPSGWIRPFNCSTISLSDWKLVLGKKSSIANNNNNNNDNQNNVFLMFPPTAVNNDKKIDETMISKYWIDVIKLYQVKNPQIEFESPLAQELFVVPSSSTATSNLKREKLKNTLFRPSEYLLQFLENNPMEQDVVLASSPLLPLHSPKFASAESFKLAKEKHGWLVNIIEKLQQGHDVTDEDAADEEHKDFRAVDPATGKSTKFDPARSVIPAFVLLLYTDCEFARKALLTLNVAIFRLHVVWSGQDETCAAETVALLRRAIPPKFLRIVHLPLPRGVPGAYNAGFRSAVSSAAFFEDARFRIPRYVFFSHADITHDDTLPKFLKFIDNEMANAHTDSGFFFGGATSLCSVGINSNSFDRAGFLDENFYPWGHSDADYVWRVHLAGLENKHDMAYRITHVNSGSFHGTNDRMLAQFSSEKRRGDPNQYCHTKWGNCEHIWTEHFPKSGFRSPFNASGLPFSHWKLDLERRDCIVGGAGYPEYNPSSATSSFIIKNNNFNNNNNSGPVKKKSNRYPASAFLMSKAAAKLSGFNYYQGGSQECVYSGESSLLGDSSTFPSMLLPSNIIGKENQQLPSTIYQSRHIVAGTFELDKDTGTRHQKLETTASGVKTGPSATFFNEDGEWSQETITSLFGQQTNNAAVEENTKIVLVSHMHADPNCEQHKILPQIGYELNTFNNNNKLGKVHLDHYMISSSTSSRTCASKVISSMRSNMQHFGIILDHHHQGQKNNNNNNNQTENNIYNSKESISKVVNLAYQQYTSLIQNNNNSTTSKKQDFWFVVISKWNSVSPSSIAKLMRYAFAVSSSSPAAFYPEFSPDLDKNVGFVIGSEFDFGAFMVHSKLFEQAGSFDENLNSHDSIGMFCLECVDLSWRGELLSSKFSSPSTPPATTTVHSLRRKVLPLQLTLRQSTFLPTPVWYHDNADYFMQKWGHAFQYELLLPRPPSGWTRPFNISSLLLNVWKIDEERRICAEETSIADEPFCWFDVAKSYGLAPAGSSSIISIEVNKAKPIIRPSWWFLRFVAPSNGSPLPPIVEKLAKEKEEKASDSKNSHLPEWLVSICASLQQGRDLHYDSKNATSFSMLPSLVSLLYTDCDLQRSMLGSIKVPLKRLIIAWNGDDACAAETVSYIRLYAPKNSYDVIFYPSNKGYAAAYNGGFQLALSEAVRNNEEPPRWSIISNGDIKYDKTLERFCAFAGKELSKPESDASFFFGGGVSFCTVGMSLETVHRAGFLDENFFPSYNEDIDYMWRAHLNGMQNKHEFSYKFDHVNGGSYRGKNQKLVSSYVSRFHRGNTKEMCHSKWGDCEGYKVWSHTPPTGWFYPFNSTGIPYSYSKLDVERWRCINKDNDESNDKARNVFYKSSEVCWFNTSIYLEDFPDFVPAEHARWQEGPVILPSIRFGRKNS